MLLDKKAVCIFQWEITDGFFYKRRYTLTGFEYPLTGCGFSSFKGNAFARPATVSSLTKMSQPTFLVNSSILDGLDDRVAHQAVQFEDNS